MNRKYLVSIPSGVLKEGDLVQKMYIAKCCACILRYLPYFVVRKLCARASYPKYPVVG